jgi:hypothetical protein
LGILTALATGCGPAEELGSEESNMIDLRAFSGTPSTSNARDSDGDIAQVTRAFSKSSCAEADADQTYQGGRYPEKVSPRSYNTCFKGYVVDIEDVDRTFTGEGSPDVDGYVRIAYADSTITSQSKCESIELRVVVYWGKLSNGNWDKGQSHDSGSRYGRWTYNALFQQYECELDYSIYGLQTGHDYRFAMTSRESGSTRKVSIETVPRIELQ